MKRMLFESGIWNFEFFSASIASMRFNLIFVLKQTLWLGLVVFLLAGCESTDGGSQVSGSVYYSNDLYDPWYYGGIYDDPDIIATPPARPEAPPRPTHPIATPPAPRPTPMPSIPSTPRPAFRR